MRKCFLFVALSAFLAMPCLLRAEEVEIQLMEVIQMTPLPGDDPLDDPDQYPSEPPRPTSFRATINGNTLSVSKQDENIPSAQAIVVNQQFTNSLLEQISAQGVYALRIETAGGALVGQFVVQ